MSYIVKVNVIAVLEGLHAGRMHIAALAHNRNGLELDIVLEGDVQDQLLVRIAFQVLHWTWWGWRGEQVVRCRS